jgi:short-subunit dehydrogenase
MNLKNKTIIVTGGTKGIGRSIVEDLVKNGSNVIILARTKSDLEQVKNELKKFPKISIFKCDVTSQSDIKKTFKKINSNFDQIDVLINNVGSAYIGPADEMSLSDWNFIINTNLTSVFLCCKEISPVMKNQKNGCIINIISNSGKNGAADFSAYCASKFGQLGFSQSLFHELRPYGIRVISICPGGVDTEMWKNVENNPKIVPKKDKALKPKHIAEFVNFILKHDEILFKEPVILPSSQYY